MHIISGIHRNKALQTPKGMITRPTTGMLRQAIFNICQLYIEDTHFLDLFAGSGAMGLEAISRGAAFATFVDKDRDSIRCIQQNIQTLKVESQAKTFSGDVFSTIKKLATSGNQYDIIYADPPYHNPTSQLKDPPYSYQLITLIDELNLLKPSGVFFIEESIDLPLYSEPLASLVLKNHRRYGKSGLFQYIRKD